MSAPQRLRILVVTLGRRGGVTEYAWLMARALTRHADVAAISSAFADNREKWAAFDGPHLEVKTFNNVAGVIVSLLDVTRFFRIWRFARQFRPDIVYYPGGHAWKPVLDVLLPKSARTVETVHDASPHPGENSIVFRLLRWANRQTADGYVLLTESQREDFLARRSIPRSPIAVIPHGVFDDYVSAPMTTKDLASRIDIAQADVGRYVLFVGRIRGYKGIDTLLKAYGALAPAEAGPLVIAGSGELSDGELNDLHALKGRPIQFINRWLPDAEMAALVASARFVVLPYRSATQSGVVPLASAFGVPAIASATGGLVEQVIDGETGLLFAPGDVDALRALLSRAYAMGERDYRLMSEKARALAAREWAWDALAMRLVRFCASLSR